ncbi:MAG: TonB-dependent receptor [Acidimicrobiia bacterium]|nr:TonB-dependent receptor [Acidimicrobiia bacterium]
MRPQPHRYGSPEHRIGDPSHGGPPCDKMRHVLTRFLHLHSGSSTFLKAIVFAHRQWSTIAAVVAVAMSLMPAVEAQGTGRVSGRVLDQTRAALPGVMIDLVVNAVEATTVTNAVGEYQFEPVPTGRAERTYRLINFSMMHRTVEVRSTTPIEVDVVLALAMNADVVVTGQRTFRNIADIDNPTENLVGIAGAASQGAITAAQLERRPLMRAGEVLETVPGLIVSQHSGEGKANQYYVRGFNLDHGTDFSTTVADVPVNTPTGAQAHGYTDTSFLMPELVSGVQFKKGPYFADEGDFSAAGAANINYLSQLERPTVSVSGG